MVCCSNEQGLSDFELMLQKKKEEQTKRRKRKDIDIINDNDDIIAQLLVDMRNAAEVRELCVVQQKLCVFLRRKTGN